MLAGKKKGRIINAALNYNPMNISKIKSFCFSEKMSVIFMNMTYIHLSLPLLKQKEEKTILLHSTQR